MKNVIHALADAISACPRSGIVFFLSLTLMFVAIYDQHVLDAGFRLNPLGWLGVFLFSATAIRLWGYVCGDRLWSDEVDG